MTVRNEMRVFALESIRGILDYVRKEYNLPEFAVKVRLDFSPRRRCSWGGRRDGENFISLALYNHYDNKLRNFPASFKEYASFASDPIIGSVLYVDWKVALLALITHELSHAIQFSAIGENMIAANGLTQSEQAKPHGIIWKKIYRDLRIKFVNQ